MLSSKQLLYIKWQSIAVTLLIVAAMSAIIIYGFGSYGIGLFVLVPFCMGLMPILLSGRQLAVSKSKAFLMGLYVLGIFFVGMLVFALEGLICIAMATPIAILLVYLGSLVGFYFNKRIKNKTFITILLVSLGVPTLSFVESKQMPPLSAVTTSITVHAPIEKVWENVIEFPQLAEPDELIFKAGIAYPINATIKGEGVGAVRYCNFTTGSFVEPITVWNQPNLLKFSVLDQPEPMKELSFWDVIHAPHLQDYFASKEGQFKLTALDSNTTLLEGTTWYYHNIKPVFYWQLWSEYILHTIHNRVLKHIKNNAENS